MVIIMKMMKLTKIVATIGPASDTEEIIEHLIEAGVNVFRFNTKHGTTQWHEERIKRVQQVANRLGKDIGILMDLQGPEIRLETFDKKPVVVEKGETLKITSEPTDKFKSICIPRKEVFESLSKGDQILIDDGSIELKVVSVSSSIIEAMTEDPGEIGHRKGVNFPGVRINLPSLIKDDLEKLDMAGVNKVDFVALSFCRTKTDVENLRKELSKRKFRSMVIAKIESREALDNIDEIVEAADGVMVARGDLGVEVPIEELAYWQKKIIEKCRVKNKPVITATQMLQSMIENLRPTRAEATDVANAVLDGTDAVMLSGETASGKHPKKSVQAMARIATFNEKHERRAKFELIPENETDMIVKAVEQMLAEDRFKATIILVFTHSGATARSLSRLRPFIPIVAATADERVVEQLTLSYGVFAVKTKFAESDFKLPNPVLEMMIKRGLVKKGDNLIVVHGQHYYEKASTNAVALVRI